MLQTEEKSMSENENTENLEEQVKLALEKVRPFLQQDGGDVEFIELDGMQVRVRLKGACGSCQFATQTLKMGIEKLMKEEILSSIKT